MLIAKQITFAFLDLAFLYLYLLYKDTRALINDYIY